MIPRYTRSEMLKIWELENKFNIWLEIECLACEKMADIGMIPNEDAIKIRKNAKYNT